MVLEPGRPCLGIPMCFQEIEAKDITGANVCFEFLQLLTTCRTLMAPGRGCLVLAILLAMVDIRLGGEDSPPPDPQSRDSHQGKSHPREKGWIPRFFSLVGKKRTHCLLTLVKGQKHSFVFFVKTNTVAHPIRHSAPVCCYVLLRAW